MLEETDDDITFMVCTARMHNLDKVHSLLYESKVSSQTIGICCSIVIWKFAYYFPLTSITRGVNLEIQNVMNYLGSIFLFCLLLVFKVMVLCYHLWE